MCSVAVVLLFAIKPPISSDMCSDTCSAFFGHVFRHVHKVHSAAKCVVVQSSANVFDVLSGMHSDMCPVVKPAMCSDSPSPEAGRQAEVGGRRVASVDSFPSLLVCSWSVSSFAPQNDVEIVLVVVFHLTL